MRTLYLTIDIGTSRLKLGVFNSYFKLIKKSKSAYSYFSPSYKQAEIDFNSVLNTIIKSICNLGPEVVANIEGVSLSVLCPGLVPMNKDGDSLSNAIIHLDRRSASQSKDILKIVSSEKYLNITGNLPYPGGISLTSILWLKQNAPDIFKKTFKMGHTNTYFVKKMADAKGFYIDPSNASFTGLYKTVKLSGWSGGLLKSFHIPEDMLPQIVPSSEVVGRINKEFSCATGIRQGVPLVIGAADTACAALGSGLINNGDLLNTTGTVEALAVILNKPYVDKGLLLRAHALKGKWISMFIIGAGGLSFEWARKVFFNEISKIFFYRQYLPQLLSEMNLISQVIFKPYLCGDRLSIRQKKASLTGLTIETDRDEVIKAIALGVIAPIRKVLDKFSKITSVSNEVNYTGLGSSFFYLLKKRYFYPFQLKPVEYDVTLSGALKLLLMGLEKKDCSDYKDIHGNKGI